MTHYSRRTLLKASAAFAGASAIGFPSIVSGQTEKIKIGHLTPLTGFLGVPTCARRARAAISRCSPTRW